MRARHQLWMAAASVLISLDSAAAHAQTAAATARPFAPWGAASLIYGTVDAVPGANTDGVGFELAGGVELKRTMRLGIRFVEWFEIPGELFDPRWRSRTLMGVIGYRIPRTVVVVTTGWGITRAWDEVAPRASIRTSFAETGLEVLIPPLARVGGRLCLVRDWSIAKSNESGPSEFGTMNQWHAGLGLAFR